MSDQALCTVCKHQPNDISKEQCKSCWNPFGDMFEPMNAEVMRLMRIERKYIALKESLIVLART